ncbi:MAG: macrolide ABC transporter ATP-binding protein [Acidithiobacillales bacterium SG8_45]|jgi:putative ABC transport system ATP-binding protein|nr:MAG: macrolide ABC transporter ATP-binding protein [Acidithiobacillales bacterium SG8_45]
MSTVSLRKVCKTFGEGDLAVHALRDVDMEIGKGDFVCLSGPSGSGKTTLLNMVGGLDRPSSGEITVADQRVDQLDKGELAEMRLRNIGFIFQAYNLIPVLTARENVEFVMQLQGISADIRRQKSKEILEEVGLSGMEDRRPSELSGGQQQRVAVARALVSEPALILADEPTANLDSVTAENLMGLLRHLNDEHGITLVISTHDKLVMSHARRLLKMHDGKIIDDIQQR